MLVQIGPPGQIDQWQGSDQSSQYAKQWTYREIFDELLDRESAFAIPLDHLGDPVRRDSIALYAPNQLFAALIVPVVSQCL